MAISRRPSQAKPGDNAPGNSKTPGLTGLSQENDRPVGSGSGFKHHLQQTQRTTSFRIVTAAKREVNKKEKRKMEWEAEQLESATEESASGELLNQSSAVVVSKVVRCC